MSTEIRRRNVPEETFLFVRRKVTQEEIGQALGEMFGAVAEYASVQGIALAGPPAARYAEMSAESLTIEAGLPVVGQPEPTAEIQLGVLGGAEVATVVHKGPYDSVGQAHQAIEEWLTQTGSVPTGAPWESYVTDPDEVADPADWLTEVNWPIGSA